MTTIHIIKNSVNISKTPLRKIFCDSGHNSVDESVAKIVTNVSNGGSTRWQLSTLDSRPIKWAIAERANNQVYLFFAKDQINGQLDIPPDVLFDISELSRLTDISLENKEYPFTISEYKGKSLGPLDDSEAVAILTMMCLKNYAAELQQDAKTIAQGLNL